MLSQSHLQRHVQYHPTAVSDSDLVRNHEIFSKRREAFIRRREIQARHQDALMMQRIPQRRSLARNDQ